MGTNYILVYRTDCGDNSPLGSVVVRFFNKKENARKAMEAAYQVEEAYQRAKEMPLYANRIAKYFRI